ncbi:MAG: glycine cleavage system aminomethyltransferase GcvT [Pseudomonadota bacterium]
MNKTALFDHHQTAKARIVPFAGWEMPLHYGSQVQEHHFIRQAVGMFDVSHMMNTDISGSGAEDFLLKMLVSDIRTIIPGFGMYSLLLNHDGGVIDDVIVYRLEHAFRLVSNAGTREKVLAWLQKNQTDNVVIKVRNDVSMLALQGPKAAHILKQLPTFPWLEPAARLRRFGFFCGEIKGRAVIVARTGYTGEDGFEIIASHELITSLWNKFLSLDVKPCGLGARDTLRLEAGLNLYGSDMDESTRPEESRLAWTIKNTQDRVFIGQEALLEPPAIQRRLIGLIVKDRVIPRAGQEISGFYNDRLLRHGVITSGTFSPSLKHGIALARVSWVSDDNNANESSFMRPDLSLIVNSNVPVNRNNNNSVHEPANNVLDWKIQIRGQWVDAQYAMPPFYRRDIPSAK